MRTQKKIILSVPFCDKGQAKKLGAMWDSGMKSWFIYSHFDLNKFQKWIPHYKSQIGFICDN